MKNKKILITRINAIGDVVMSTIIPYAIKLKHPECEIHYLTGSTNAKMLENCPYVDKAIAYSGDAEETRKEALKEKYDCIICLNYTLKSYYISFLSFPKKVIFKSHKGTSWVENYFNTAKKLYKDLTIPNRLYMSNKRPLEEYDIIKAVKDYPRPWILFNPGKLENQARQGRVWDIEKWKELSKKISEKYGGTIFANGGIDEKKYHDQLLKNGILVVSGIYNINESCALISASDLVITGDSGPGHIASAYNKNTIALLGSTSPDKIKPYGKNGYFIEPTTKCRYCWKKKCKFLKDNSGYAPCIESITPDMVMKKIEQHNLLEPKKHMS